MKLYEATADPERRLEARQKATEQVGEGHPLIRNEQVGLWAAPDRRQQLEREARRWGSQQVCRVTSRRNVDTFLVLDHCLWHKVKTSHDEGQAFSKRTLKTWFREIIEKEKCETPVDWTAWLKRWCSRYSVTFKKPARTSALTLKVILEDAQEFHAQLLALFKLHDFALADIANSDESPLTPAGGMTKDTQLAIVAGAEPAFAQKDITSETYKCGSFFPILPGDGSWIPPIVILKGGARNAESEAQNYDPRCSVHFTASGNVDEKFMLDVYIPHLNRYWRPTSTRRLLIMDHYKSHYTQAVLDSFNASGISLVLIPKGRTSFMQILDTHCFKDLKELHKTEADKFAVQQRANDWHLTASWKRVLVTRFATRSWDQWLQKHKQKIGGWMVQLGYVKPTAESISLRNLKEYTFDPAKPPKYPPALATRHMMAPDPIFVDAPRAIAPPKTPVRRPVGRPKAPTPKQAGPTLHALFQHLKARSQSSRAESQAAQSQPIDPLLAGDILTQDYLQ